LPVSWSPRKNTDSQSGDELDTDSDNDYFRVSTTAELLPLLSTLGYEPESSVYYRLFLSCKASKFSESSANFSVYRQHCLPFKSRPKVSQDSDWSTLQDPRSSRCNCRLHFPYQQ
jgi:hypothetical protein